MSTKYSALFETASQTQFKRAYVPSESIHTPLHIPHFVTAGMKQY
jgi:hypothetical protein